MRAMAFGEYGGPEVLQPIELPMPQLQGDEVLIKVETAAVNPADGKWRSGMFSAFAPVQFPHVPGYDVAGTIVQGEGHKPGDRVVAMLDTFQKGGYAEYAKVASGSVAPIPDDLSFELAAALPTAGLTGLQAIEKMLDVQAGQRILITGALGAVGQVAVHFALERGAQVIAGVRVDQAEAALAKGAAEVAILGAPWVGQKFAHVVDTIGGSEVAALCEHVQEGGRVVTVATTPIPADTLPVIPEFFGVEPDGAGLARLVRAAASGALPVAIGRVFALEEAAEAQIAVEAGGTGGKVILKL